MRIPHSLKALGLAVSAAAIAATAPGAGIATPAAVDEDVMQSQGFRKALTLQGVREHQAAFQVHGDDHGGNRVGGSDGFEASANYVSARAAAAGYTVSDHSFTFVFNADRTPPTLRQLSPDDVTYVDGVDYTTMTFSGSADVTAPVWAADAGSTSSGCDAADFAGFAAGSIALVKRGGCTFRIKAQNAYAAGAAGVIVFNNTAGFINGTLGGPGITLPTVGTTTALGEDLANGVTTGDTGSVARLRVDRINETRPTRNVIAETAGGDPNSVIVVGAHLDSVSRGPGINDNGSGSAAILEIAEVLAAREIAPRNKIRFMWFGAEEFGLLGSRAYVADLPAAERSKIKAMLNFDMIGSPNYVRFVYDGDNSAFSVPSGAQDGPPGSGELERVFHDYFSAVGLASAETPFNGRSDYGPFIAAGVDIPAGGLFTGAEGIKTPAQAAVYGGTAGQPFDPCYHLACDTYANNSDAGLSEMSDAAGHAVLTLAKRNLEKNPLVDPSGPVSGSGGTTSGGGGLHDDDHEALAE